VSSYYVSSYYCICVLIPLCVLTLLYMCPHTTIYMSSYSYISSVLILLYIYSALCKALRYCSSSSYICVPILLYVRPVLILPYMCPHTTIYVSSYSYYYICVEHFFKSLKHPSYYYICVLILLDMCPHTHTTIYVLSIAPAPP
jgi:hypothetical protein